MSSGGSNRKIIAPGSTFNHLTLVGDARSAGDGMVGDFRCTCGTIKTIKTAMVARGKVKSCGCMMYAPEVIAKRREVYMKTRGIAPEAGERYGFLTFDGNTSTIVSSGKSRFMGYFTCDCGAVLCKEISSVRSGKIKSCGCMTNCNAAIASRVESTKATMAEKKKPKVQRSRIVRERHNYDAMPRRTSVSIGSGFSLI